MKLLLDANLSWRLIKKLEPVYGAVFYAEQVGLPDPAPDIEIWNWALDNNAIIVTNDVDFYYLILQKDFPPKVILLRTGNLSTNKIADILTDNYEAIKEWDEENKYGILEVI